MKIAMIGSGAAGSVFAAFLKKGGADMYLVDRYKAHMDKIAADGLIFSCRGEECCLKGFSTTDSAANLPVMDIVILMVKATQTDGVMPEVMHCVGPDTVLVSLQNGLGNDEILGKYVPANRIMYGAGVIGTALDGPGGCISTPSEGVIMNFGALENNELTIAAGKHMEECFNKGGCEAVFREDVLPFLWKKVVVNCTVNTVCAVLRLKIGYVEADPNGQKLFHDVIRECCAVANAKGVALDPDEFIRVDHQHIIDNISDYYPSMAQDVLWKKYRTEIDTLNGAISDYGKQFGIPTPTCDVLSTVIRCIQNNYDNQYKDQ